MNKDYSYKFPHYARLYPGGGVMVCTYVSDDGISAQYYRPCGEWGCTINEEHYQFICLQHPTWKINLIACTPEEFLKDNSYCVNKSTVKYFEQAINTLKCQGKIDCINSKVYYGEPNVNGTIYRGYWIHKVIYKQKEINVDKYILFEL